jgi:hypothetical protein
MRITVIKTREMMTMATTPVLRMISKGVEGKFLVVEHARKNVRIEKRHSAQSGVGNEGCSRLKSALNAVSKCGARVSLWASLTMAIVT